MQGEFDGLLKWPLKAVMKLALLNLQLQGADYKLNIVLNYSKCLGDGAGAVECGSCTTGPINLVPYLLNGCLHIRISYWYPVLGQIH